MLSLPWDDCVISELAQGCSRLKAKLVTIFLRQVWNHTFSPNCSVWQSESVCVWFVWHVWICLSKISSLCLKKILIVAPNPHYNPTEVYWRLMPGPYQEWHFPVHHLRVGKPWANGWANPSTDGWDVDAKFSQHGKGNWKSCRPSRPGQRNSRNPEWEAFKTTCCFRNSSDFFHLNKSCTCCDFLSTHKAVTRQSWPTAGSEWVLASHGMLKKRPEIGSCRFLNGLLQHFDVTWSRGMLQPSMWDSAPNLHWHVVTKPCLDHADFRNWLHVVPLHVVQIQRTLRASS